MSEETALMALRPPKGSKNTTEWFDRWGVKMCRNNEGLEFACGDGECCGQVCKAEGDLCCRNDLCDAFPCQAGGECCGNACAAPGSKCCNKGKHRRGRFCNRDLPRLCKPARSTRRRRTQTRGPRCSGTSSHPSGRTTL